MFYGDNVVARAWSFSDDMAEIPYLIKRFGRPKKSGGTGYKWGCSCPYFTNRHRTCKHITELHKAVTNKTILLDKRYQISDLGMEILRII